MKNTAKKNWKVGLTILICVAAILALYFSRGDMVGLCVNSVALIIMSGTIIWGYYDAMNTNTGISCLLDATEDLKNATNAIKELAKNPETNIQESLHAEGFSLFTTPLLSNAYRNHCTEWDRLYRNGSTFQFIDINDQLNHSLINRIARSSYNNLIGGSMTGLGILGTFIGLMFGLQDFDPSTADSMMSTILPLIEGIKVAFITSIMGVVFSLFFNLLYKKATKAADNSLSDFLDTYYQYVTSRPENNGFTQLIQCQQKQTDSMSQFAEQISISMGHALVESVVPTFDKIGSHIKDLTVELSNQQHESLDAIVDNISQNIGKSLEKQLQNLRNNIDQLCLWQDATIKQMQTAVDTYLNTSENLDSVGAGLNDSVQSMGKYVSDVADIQAVLDDKFNTTANVLTQLNEKIEQQCSSFDNLLQKVELLNQVHQGSAVELAESVSVIAAKIEKVGNTVCDKLENSTTTTISVLEKAVSKQVEGTLEQLKDVNSAYISNISAINDAVGSMKSSMTDFTASLCSELEQAMTSTVKTFNDAISGQANQSLEMAEQVNKAYLENASAINYTIESMKSNIDKFTTSICSKLEHSTDSAITSLNKAISSQSGQVMEQSRNMNTLYQESATIMGETIDTLKSSIITLSDTICVKLNQSTEKTMSALDEAVSSNVKHALTQVEHAERNIASIEKLQTVFVEEMQNASSGLTDSAKRISAASNDLTNNLDKAMSHTYQKIDEQMADILQHLSGTILEIKDITESLPMNANLTLTKMQKSVQSYISSIASSQKELLQLIHASDSKER